MEDTKNQIHQAFEDLAIEVNKDCNWNKINQIIEKGVRAYSELRRLEAEAKRQETYQRLDDPRPDYIPATEQTESEEQIKSETNQVYNKFKNNKNKLLGLVNSKGKNNNRGSKERRDWLNRIREYGLADEE